MTPIYATHFDSADRIMSVVQADYSYKMSNWLNGLTFAPGDRIEFDAIHVRKDEEAAPALSAVAS